MNPYTDGLTKEQMREQIPLLEFQAEHVSGENLLATLEHIAALKAALER